MPKRAELPKANDLLIGRKPLTSKDRKIKSTKGAKFTPPKGEKSKRVQISVHFAPATLKMIETAKYKLFTEYDIKATKSDIIEAAVKENVADPKRLIEILK